MDLNNGFFVNLGTGGIGGNGTIGTIPIFTSTKTLGDSVITQPAVGYINVGAILSANQFYLPKNTPKGVVALYNDTIGDAYGIEQVSYIQSGSVAQTRIFTSSQNNSAIGFGYYTTATAFTTLMQIYNNGDARLVGSMGVGGSISGSYKLNVTGKIYASSEIVTNGDFHLTNDAFIYSSAGGTIDGFLLYGSTHSVLIKTNGTTALTIDTSQNSTFVGSVGIGGTPSSLLHLKGTAGSVYQRFDTAVLIGFIGEANGLISGSNANTMALRSENGLYLSGAGNAQTLYLDNANNATFGGQITSTTIKTGVGIMTTPSAITRFGGIKAGAIIPNATQYLEEERDGVLYKIVIGV
jgi:hypothetical protein